ncbi:GRIP and coiled-coil domain-containing protein 2 [Contarinia nasturtii]|uniref:GRIP and coiled-coil domain-containing protein 2 n=1 Tax=Contarinia nasturtii TaxID=265458 RepID=UPI0012D4AC11|nr:GRIP and coiled-coil domain-containing protein 2 [Contarinia nasturtii]
MDSSVNASSEKKGVFESLDREDLIRKCKGLLVIAQKAKKSKDELANEVTTLKEKLAECDTQKQADKDCLKTMQLIVDSLTQNKLEAANQIADLEKSIKNLNHQLNTCNDQLTKLSELEIENEAKAKQIQRLTNENEEQEIDLRKLDEKFTKVSELSQHQTQELLVLEQSIDKWKTMEAAYHKLQYENRELQTKFDAFNASQTAASSTITNEEIINNLQVERDNNRRMYEEASVQFYLLNEELDKLQQSRAKDDEKIDVLKEQLHHENKQLKKKCEEQTYKLDKYKGKICEFSSKLKEVKQSKKLLSDLLVDYSLSVTKWHTQISHASKLLVKEVNYLNETKLELEKQIECRESTIGKLKETIDELGQRIENVTKNNDTGEIREKYEMLLTEYKSLQKCIEDKNSEIVNITQEWEQMCSSLQEESVKCGSEIEKVTKECQNKSKQLYELEEKSAADNKENTEFSNETKHLNDMVEKLKIEIDYKNYEINKLTQESEQINVSLKEQYEKFTAEIKERNDECQAKIQTICELEEKEMMSRKMNDALLTEISLLNEKLQDLSKTIGEVQSDTSKDDEINDNEMKYGKLQEEHKSLQSQIVEKNDELNKLAQELEIIRDDMKKLTEENQVKCKQVLVLEEKEVVANKKHEELLAEMRELNDVIKKRGEIISNQTTEIDQYKVKLSDQYKQINSLEENVKDKIKQLEQLRNQFDNQNEILSTSTISRADEVSRMRDIEDSFEEKYNKLRAIALKLKKKNAELQATVAKLELVKSTDAESTIVFRAAVPVQAQNLISLQKDNDRLLDQIDAMKSEQKQLNSQIKQLNEQIKKTEEEAKSLRIVNEDIKVTAETSLKIKSEIESLKNDNKNIIQQMKNAENEIVKLKDVVKQKENEIIQKAEEASKIKSEMNKLMTTMKKSSVLNLEVEAYEKSLTEISQKYETNLKQLSEAKTEIETHQNSIKLLNMDIQSLTNQLEIEKQNSNEYQQQTELQRIKLKENNTEISELNRIIDEHVNAANQIKIELTNLQSQQSENEVEKQRFISKQKIDNENNVTKILSLEEEARNLRNKLNNCEQELSNVQTDFASYKIKAQTVLKAQSKESSSEEELKEELAILTKTKDDLNAKLTNACEQHRRMENTIDELKDERTNLQDRCKKLLELLDETRQQIESMQSESRKQTKEHHEALKIHRLQVDTLNNCFKNQIEEMQKRHEEEVTALKSSTLTANKSQKITEDSGLSFAKCVQLTTEQRIELLMNERQDGEGSECTSTNQRKVSRGKHEVMPLEELLASNTYTYDEELETAEPNEDNRFVSKEKFEAEQSRLKHLSTLLSEAEMDVTRLSEMNVMLKEELRRQERSTEREKEMKNLEYMKNVIFKFLTINNVDERAHLVPVLNIILKLSPDESKTLQSVARGESISWSNLLPTW